MTEVVTRPTDHAQIGRTVGLSESPGVKRRHGVVVAAVDQEQIPGRKAAYRRLRRQRPQSTGPFAKVGWKVRVGQETCVSGMQQQPAGVVRPVRPVGRCRQCTDTVDSLLNGCSTDRKAGTGTETNRPHTAHLHADLVSISQVPYRSQQVISPAVEAEVAIRTGHAAKVGNQRHPPQFPCNPVGQFRKCCRRVGSSAGPTGEPVAYQNRRHSPVCCGMTIFDTTLAIGCHQMPGQAQCTRPEVVVFLLLHDLSPRGGGSP